MRRIQSGTVDWFTAARRGGGLTRSALASGPVDPGDWRGPSGRRCLASARALLPELADAVGVRLPEAEALDLDPHAAPSSGFPDVSVARRLRDLGPVRLDRVTDAEDRRRWESMVATHHPEGWRRPPGGQVRYWVRP